MNRNAWLTRVHWTNNLPGKHVDKWEYNGFVQFVCMISSTQGSVIWTNELASKVVVQVYSFYYNHVNKDYWMEILIHKHTVGFATYRAVVATQEILFPLKLFHHIRIITSFFLLNSTCRHFLCGRLFYFF